MNKFVLKIKVPAGKVQEILDRLTEAQKVIYECYNELNQLGVLEIEDQTDSGN